jgi:hypothetical protein
MEAIMSRDIYIPTSFDTGQTQAGIDAGKTEKRRVVFEPGTHNVTGLKYYTNSHLWGATKEVILQKSQSNNVTVADGNIDGVLVLDRESSSEGRDFIIENMTIRSGDSIDIGLFLGTSCYFDIKRLDIEGFDEGIRGYKTWQGLIESVTSYQCGYGFRLDNPGSGIGGTSILFNKCHADVCNYGFRLNDLRYSTLNSCAVDNMGDSGNFRYAYRLVNVQAVLNGCGLENSYGGFVYCEASYITLNSCHSVNVKSAYGGPYTKAFLHQDGGDDAALIVNSSDFRYEIEEPGYDEDYNFNIYTGSQENTDKLVMLNGVKMSNVWNTYKGVNRVVIT